MSHTRRTVVTVLAVAATSAAPLAPTTAVDAAVAPQARAASEPSAARAPDPATLGNGLGRLLAQRSGAASAAGGSGLLDEEALTLRDGRGRILVQVTPRSDADPAAFRARAERLGLRVTAVDPVWRTLEGYASPGTVRSLAGLEETGTIARTPRPLTSVGATTSQAVALQRVDAVHRAGVTGSGLTIGVLSDSYDTAPTEIRAADDIASADLPGPGNPDHPEPIVVIEEGPPERTDEGRAMLQLVHDVAPDARLCFATAFTGELGFAANIRALADPEGPCGADVIVDDVFYFNEPMFSDGTIGDAVDDVVAGGTAYFTSAGNQGIGSAWAAPLHLVSADRAVRGSNLDLSSVDPDLYAGGFQDMDPGPGVDVAQDYAIGTGSIVVQWNDPFDLDGPSDADGSRVTTDFDLLLFNARGRFLRAVGDDNRATGRPLEIVGFAPERAGRTVQVVLARRTTGPTPVTRLGSVAMDAVKVTEYVDPAAPAGFGHQLAASAISVAAYDPFGPFHPEPFTSPGGRREVFFDSAGQRYAQPQVRLRPDLASTDAANTTFFGSVIGDDGDDFPNFYGTSAAAPHAAAIGALAVEAAGGPGSIAPEDLRLLLRESTFAHDLDPFASSGRAGGLTVRARGAEDWESQPTPGALGDPGFFRVTYRGRSPLRAIRFLGASGSPSSRAGLVFDPRPLGPRGAYSEGGFPFQVGSSSRGLRPATIRARYAKPFRRAGVRTYRNLTVRFGAGLRRGQSFTFGIDRDLAVPVPGRGPSLGNSADELGGTTLLPSGEADPRGLRFVAIRADGTRLRGRMVNRLGSGWTAVDGYGLVDAETAVRIAGGGTAP